MQDHAPPIPSREDFIAAMRKVAASVTVVTTDGPFGRWGTTVSAFTSVSADPPTALVCLHADSRIAQKVSANGQFCVNVLPQGRRDIANRFAGTDDAAVADRFEGVDVYGPSGDPPAINGATMFQCRVTQSVLSGSHLVFFGAVEAVDPGNGQPLAYLDGSYHAVVREQE